MIFVIWIILKNVEQDGIKQQVENETNRAFFHSSTMVLSTRDVRLKILVMILGVRPRLMTKELLLIMNSEIAELDALVLGVFTKAWFKQWVR